MNINYTYDYNLKYNNLPVTTGRFTYALQSINYNIEEDSNDRLLRPYYEYNVEYFRNSVSISNITTFSISGGTFRTDANKFYFTADNNYINNGTLILRSILVPIWYGSITMEILSWRPAGRISFYNYTIYKGSTTASDVLVEAGAFTNSFNIINGQEYQLSEVDRIENSSSPLLLVITSTNIGSSYYLNYVENATYPSTYTLPYGAQVTALPAYYTIIPSTSTIPSNITIRFFTI
jgi:hypothetical protein